VRARSRWLVVSTSVLVVLWTQLAWAGPSPWQVQDPQDPGAYADQFYGVSSTSASNAWAVGCETDSSDDGCHALIEHYDGSAWTVDAVPAQTNFDVHLNAVRGTSASNAWAVGSTQKKRGGLLRTVIDHWDGTSWTRQPSPTFVGVSTQLLGVAATSASDAWAVGGTDSFAVIEHDDGTSWTNVPFSRPSGFSRLQGVASPGSSDVWAVGYTIPSAILTTFIEHYDGTGWTRVASPNRGSDDNWLFSVSAVSGNDIWAVGYSGPSGSEQTLIEHFDGTSWSIVPSPNASAADNELLGVKAIAADDVWAVGFADDAPQDVLIEHYDGVAWSIVAAPHFNGHTDATLFAVGGTSSKNVFAVGDRKVERKALVLHCC